MELVAQFPEAFPKITSLERKDDNNVPGASDHIPARPSGSIYAAALGNWEGIESLIDNTHYLDIATHLLKSTCCRKLTHLKAAFEYWSEIKERGKIIGMQLHGNFLQDLIKNIHNAPSLQHASFSRTIIRLMDMGDCISSYRSWKVLT